MAGAVHEPVGGEVDHHRAAAAELRSRGRGGEDRAVAGREIHSKGLLKITFDENGFSADQSVYFREDRADPRLIWSVHVNGLSGTTKTVENREGMRDKLRTTEESDF